MKYLLIGIVFLGICLRLLNLSPFKIYPDSYLQLILAENIQTSGKIIGTLGSEGMLYPDFLAWTRPMFPLLLSILHIVSPDTTRIAVILSFFSSILSIPLCFFVLKKLFYSTAVGLLGALLLAVSFNHAVWSGFILTESLGVLFMMAFLYAIFSYKKENKSLLYDVVTGILFACCVLTRYEYSLVVFPVILYLHSRGISWGRITSIFSVGILCLVIIFLLLFPKDALLSLFTQFLPHIQSLLALLGVFSLGIVLWPKIKRGRVSQIIDQIVPTLWVVFCLLLLTHTFLYPFPFLLLNGISDFIKTDILISLCFMAGTGIMLYKKFSTKELLLVFLSSILLYAAYYRANPYSQRYLVHLLPFFLTPASYFLSEMVRIVKTKRLHSSTRAILFFSVCLLLFYQFFLSFIGMRTWQHGLYNQVSYEEKAGSEAKKMLPDDSILLVSFPESYYVTTHHSVYSLTDSPPFIYIPDTLSGRELIIIEDMGMHDIFPTFTKFLKTSLKDKKKQSFFTHTPYQYADRILPEKYPVILYQIKVSDLKMKIQQQFPDVQTF